MHVLHVLDPSLVGVALVIVCVCHRVTERDIGHAVSKGCGDFEQLQDELRVGTACGACLECARRTFEACGAETAPSRPRRIQVFTDARA
jgi:bacterioferritin-associated ferredoxin